MKSKLLLSGVLLLVASGCSVAGPKFPHRAAVVMKIAENEGHVCMGIGEVSPGDRVSLFKSQCTRSAPSPKGRAASVCKRVELGEGEVISTINEHYSVIRVDPGVQFDEGTMVEKKG